MNQIALALEHYWHLRAQGVLPSGARRGIIQRFGVNIPTLETENASEICSVIPPREPSTDFGTEFTNTVWGSSTGPQDALRSGR